MILLAFYSVKCLDSTARNFTGSYAEIGSVNGCVGSRLCENSGTYEVSNRCKRFSKNWKAFVIIVAIYEPVMVSKIRLVFGQKCLCYIEVTVINVLECIHFS